jgi:excisionase family DNA binding protein
MRKVIYDGQKPDPVITEKDAAEMLGISKSTLKRIRDAKEISFYRIGGQVFYSPEIIRAFLERCLREVK